MGEKKQFIITIDEIILTLLVMSGSCHLDRVLNIEIGVECQIFFIVIFFNGNRVLQVEAHSRYYKGALTRKRSFLVICTTYFQI